MVDDPAADAYPMAIDADGQDGVLVGRIRRDLGDPNALALWVVADNLRKGAATNAVRDRRAARARRPAPLRGLKFLRAVDLCPICDLHWRLADGSRQAFDPRIEGFPAPVSQPPV